MQFRRDEAGGTKRLTARDQRRSAMCAKRVLEPQNPRCGRSEGARPAWRIKQCLPILVDPGDLGEIQAHNWITV